MAVDPSRVFYLDFSLHAGFAISRDDERVVGPHVYR